MIDLFRSRNLRVVETKQWHYLCVFAHFFHTTQDPTKHAFLSGEGGGGERVVGMEPHSDSHRD